MEISTYKSEAEWRKAEPNAHAAGYRAGLLPSIRKMAGWKQPIRWTKKLCIQEAKKYKTRTEWKKNSSSSYTTAHKNKWLPECTKHMIEIQKPNGYWTKKLCIEYAKKYKTRSEWKKNSSSSYNVALRNKWIPECSKHMK